MMSDIVYDQNLQLVKDEFDNEISKLRIEGSNHSKQLAVRLEDEKKYLIEKFDNLRLLVRDHISENKSDIVSIKQSNRLLWEDTLPKLNAKIDTSIKYSQDAMACTSESNKIVAEAADLIVQNKKDNKLFFWSVLSLLLLAVAFPQVMKLIQDNSNQKQTLSAMEQIKLELMNMGKGK
jgi:hypothetical protein